MCFTSILAWITLSWLTECAAEDKSKTLENLIGNAQKCWDLVHFKWVFFGQASVVKVQIDVQVVCFSSIKSKRLMDNLATIIPHSGVGALLSHILWICPSCILRECLSD